MRKNLIYLTAVLVLLIIFYFLKIRSTEFLSSDSNFRVEDISEIGSIEIKDKYGNKVKLNKKDENWTVENSYPAEDSKIKMLLETLNKLEIDFPVSDTLRPVAIENLRHYGIEVTINNEDRKTIKTLFIGGQYKDGNYMILSEDGRVSPNPYVVKIPGFKGDLKYRFLAIPKMWKSTSVFSTSIDKIKSIRVDHHLHPEYSFLLEKDDDAVKIDPIHDSMKINTRLDQNKVIQFLLEFEFKHFETWIENDSTIAEIKSKSPYISIEIVDITNKKRSIVFYQKPPSNKYGETVDATGKPLLFDLDKYWSYLPESKEYVLTQHYVFGPIMETYDYFFEEDKKKIIK